MDGILRFDFILLALLITSKLGMHGDMTTASEWWIPGIATVESISIDSTNHIFLIQTSNEISCARACKRNALGCSMINYKASAQECRGYSETAIQRVEGSCILPEYTFHPVFDVCIRAYYNTVTQAEAESTCGRDMAYLIITDSLVKIKAYETFMKKSRSWVGLYDQNAKAPGQDFRWNNGDSLSVTSTLWGPGEPTVYYNMEHCALGGYYLGGLADDVCDDKYLFACQENI